MRLHPSQIERAQSDATDVWTFGNRMLYRMCQEYPAHEEVSVVAGKMLLIGRSYAAAVERRVIPSASDRIATDAFYELYVAPALIASKIDSKLRQIQQHPEFSVQSLPLVLDAHHHLVAIMQRLVNQSKRSLASKYLHFHAPAQVPIYDSIAAGRLSQLMPRRRVKYSSLGDVDATYARFALLLLNLRDDVEREFGARLTPRELDRLLLQTSADTSANRRPLG